MICTFPERKFISAWNKTKFMIIAAKLMRQWLFKGMHPVFRSFLDVYLVIYIFDSKICFSEQLIFRYNLFMFRSK